MRHVLVWNQSGWNCNVGHLLTNATTVILELHDLVVIALDQFALVGWEQITAFMKVNLTLEFSRLASF